MAQPDDQDDDSDRAPSSSEDSMSFVPIQKPRKSVVSAHNNNVVEQELPDTTGVEITFDFSALKEGGGKPRTSIMSADFSQRSLKKKDLPEKLSPPTSPPPSPAKSPPPSPSTEHHDGIQTQSPPTTPPPTPPPLASEGKETEDLQPEPPTDPPVESPTVQPEEGPSDGPASPPAPPLTEPEAPKVGERQMPRRLSSKVFETFLDSTPPVLCAPPEKKKKKKRKKKLIPVDGPKDPWPVLVRVDDQPTNKHHAAFLDEVSLH